MYSIITQVGLDLRILPDSAEMAKVKVQILHVMGPILWWNVELQAVDEDVVM